MTPLFHQSPLTRRRFLTRSALVTGAALGAGTLLEACGGSSPATTGTQQPVTLKFMHWIGSDNGPAVAEINKRFHQENPSITVEFSSVPSDQYATVLNAHLTGGDAPDVFGVFPGLQINPYAKAGYLTDLSNEPWVSRLQPGVQRVSSYHNKVYILPTAMNVIGVVYNKQIFSQHGISIPTNWDDFLAVCQKLKDAGVTPLALGAKDLSGSQFMLYAMAPSAIYAKNSTFDQEMFAGTQTFANSPWTQMVGDFVNLSKRGFFNQGILGTDYNQTMQLMASGKTAMIVHGIWTLGPIQALNPNIQLGMFPLPYAKAGDPIWVSSGVGSPLAISATTKHSAETRKYLQFWARKDINQIIIESRKGFSSLSDVTNPTLAPGAQTMEAAMKAGTYNYLDQNWPVGPQATLQKDMQGVFAGSVTIPQMLQDMDKTFQQNKAAVS